VQRRALLAAFGTGLVAGCATTTPCASPDANSTAANAAEPTASATNVDWPAPHRTPANTGRAPTTYGPDGPGPPVAHEWRLWEFAEDVGRQGSDGDGEDRDVERLLRRSRFTSPVADGDRLFVATGPRSLPISDDDPRGGFLFAVDPATDRPAWTTVLASGATGSPALFEGCVVVPTSDGSVVAVDAVSGDRRWRRSFGAPAGTPTVADGRLFLGSVNGHLRALGPDGHPCWSIRRGPPVAGVGLGRRPSARCKPAVDADHVYQLFTREQGASVLVAVSRDDGDVVWTTTLDTDGRDARAPAVDHGTVYVPMERTLHALDAATGAEQWRYAFGPVPTVSTPAVGDSRLFVCAKNVHALDVDTGTEAWRFVNEWTGRSPGGGRVPMEAAPVVADDTVYAGAGALDVETGTKRWGDLGNDPESPYFQYGTDSMPTREGPALTDTALAVVTQFGLLVRFVAEGDG
jgi:outer membrane protein assembly factor BamB